MGAPQNDQADTDWLERIQRQAARFTVNDYHVTQSREPGCVTNMLHKLDLPTLQDQLTRTTMPLFFKVVEGLVLAIPVTRTVLKTPSSKQKTN